MSEGSKKIKDLLISQVTPALIGSPSGLGHNDAVIEAYRRGVTNGVLAAVYDALDRILGAMK